MEREKFPELHNNSQDRARGVILGRNDDFDRLACGAERTLLGDEPFNEIFHPIAVRLLEKCDAVLRVGGPSAGSNEMVRVERSLGLRIYASLAEIPGM